MIEKLIVEHKTAARVWYNSVWYSYGPAVFAFSFFFVLFLLQWVFNYELFYEIMIENKAGLPFETRFDIFVDAIGNVFQYADDLTPISLILISFFQASILTIWWRLRLVTRASKLRMGALGVGIIGSGCVACGSSLLPVIIDLVGASLSITLVQAVGDILLMLAVVLSYRATLKLALRASAALG